MVYGDIQTVRRWAGKRPQYAHDATLKKGDGTETEFYLLYVGFNEGYVLDKSALTTISLTVADITVYVNDVAVTVDSIDQDKGTVILNVAPADGADVSADYRHSDISDEMILESMEDTEQDVNALLNGSIDTVTNLVLSYDGDGVKTEFTMKKYDVTNIVSVVVNGATKTLNTDYFIYYYADNTRIEYIKFSSPPSGSTLQNVVVTVDHGMSTPTLVKLANIISARSVLLNLPDSSMVGEYKKGSQGSGRVPATSRIRMLNAELAKILDNFDRRDIYV